MPAGAGGLTCAIVAGEEPPCSLWDVLKVLNERDEDHRIYLHLTAQLEAAFYKATRHVASASFSQLRVTVVVVVVSSPFGDAALLASEGGLSGVDALAAKLGKLKALKIANVLHMNVKKVVPITPYPFPPSALWLIGISSCAGFPSGQRDRNDAGGSASEECARDSPTVGVEYPQRILRSPCQER